MMYPMPDDNKSLYAVRKSSDGQFYFYLRGANGQILVTSETYKAKQSALDGIAAVKRVAANAPVVDISD